MVEYRHNGPRVRMNTNNIVSRAFGNAGMRSEVLGKLLTVEDIASRITADAETMKGSFTLSKLEKLRTNDSEDYVSELYKAIPNEDNSYNRRFLASQKASIEVVRVLIKYIGESMHNVGDYFVAYGRKNDKTASEDYDKFASTMTEFMHELDRNWLHDLYKEPVNAILYLLIPLLIIISLADEIQDRFIVNDLIVDYVKDHDYQNRLDEIIKDYYQSFQEELKKDKTRILSRIDGMLNAGEAKD